MKIPPLLPPDQMPPITDAAVLEETWRALMGELGFARAQVYLLFVDAGRPLFVSHVEEVPAHPLPPDIAALTRVLERLPVPEVSVAFLYCRPGAAALTPADRTWARGLARFSPWPVHVASDDDIVPVAPDDLVEAC